jgi:hypothetical protein
MRLVKTGILFTFMLLLAWLFAPVSQGKPAAAQFVTPTPSALPLPGASAPRITTIQVPFNSYQWWLIRYSNNQIVCAFSVEHEGLPTPDDVFTFCDRKVYDEWVTTDPCNQAKVDALNQCPGFYLQVVGQRSGERPLEIELPVPSVWVSIANCNALAPDPRCTTLPSLVLNAEEPLPNETILTVQGAIGGEPFSCMGETCAIPLPPTGMDGITMEFWADSSFGDSTPRYTARVRLIPWGDFMNPEQGSRDEARWYVDILSSQWRDGELATCSETWDVFPPIGGPPEWLRSPETRQELESDVSYYYLAGSLITYGVVDASGCIDGGLQAPNIASPCGVEAARPQLLEWQNRFDDQILHVSQETGVPARLLKNVFARESQIWPGIYTTYKEAGLGQLTSNGADTVLLWNDDLFHQFCPLVLNQAYCEGSFWQLGEPEQAMLRGALVRKVDASCPGCPAGIDLSEADYSVRVFAEGMLANCKQAGQAIYNVTGFSPGQVSSYEDLWRFTLVNYNAGAGCLTNAVARTWAARQPIVWGPVASYLDPACQPAIGYVEDISRLLKPSPTPTTWLPLGTAVSTPILPRVLATHTPTVQPFEQPRTPTPTQAGQPTATPTRPGGTPAPTSTPGPTETELPTPDFTQTYEAYPYP